MKLLVYVRPWSLGYFQCLTAAAFPDWEIVFISDFRGLGAFPLSQRFHGHYERRPARLEWPDWLSGADEYEILARNYLLRTLPLQKGRRMAAAMSRAIGEAFDAIRPDAVLMMSADSYVLDLLGRWAWATGRPCCGIIPCPFPGYTRATARGEYNAFREVSDEEAGKALATMTDPAFRPVDLVEWLKTYGPWLSVERAAREKPKRIVFPVLARLRRDPLNYHYMSSAVSRVSVVSQGLLIERHFERDWEARLAAWRGPRIYFPLQAYPESTTDLHVPQLELIDFESLLFRILDRLEREPELLVVVKEHPGMMGARPPGFYEGLLRHPNVLLLSGSASAIRLIELCDLVLTWPGTGGLEAGVRRKPVIAIGRSYYSDGPLYRTVTRRSQIEDLPALVRAALAEPVAAAEPVAIVKRVLASSFPGEFRYVGFDEAPEPVKQEARHLGRALRLHWDAWAAAFPAAYSAHLRAAL